MLLCFQIRVNFTLVLCIACYHFEFGIAVGYVHALTIAIGLSSMQQFQIQKVANNTDISN
jgi:hypothetical protein